ncbi:unnamed protein product [Caretta caretta]
MLNAPRSDPGRWKLCELRVLQTGCSQKGDCPRVLTGFMGSSSRALPGDSVTATHWGVVLAAAQQHQKCVFGQRSHVLSLGRRLEGAEWMGRCKSGVRPVMWLWTYRDTASSRTWLGASPGLTDFPEIQLQFFPVI